MDPTRAPRWETTGSDGTGAGKGCSAHGRAKWRAGFMGGYEPVRSVHHTQDLPLSLDEKPILSNRSSKSPIEPVEMGLGTVRTKAGQMVRNRFG